MPPIAIKLRPETMERPPPCRLARSPLAPPKQNRLGVAGVAYVEETVEDIVFQNPHVLMRLKTLDGTDCLVQ